MPGQSRFPGDSIRIDGLGRRADGYRAVRAPMLRRIARGWKLEQAREAYRKFDQQSAGKGVFLM